MTKIHVLAGGTSSEREVSLRSGASVAAALEQAGHQVYILDPANTSIEEMVACDVIFPALHGKGAEDGSLQTEFEKRHARFVGSDAAASALCFDKWRYREFAIAHDLPMAEGALVTRDKYRSHPLLTQPFALKPIDGGSSIDTHLVRDHTNIPYEEIEDTFSRHDHLLVERLITGIELTVGILGDQILPVIEIIPPEGENFDYENKYNGATRELCPAQNVSEAVQKRAQELAYTAHRLTGCRDMSRTDIMYEITTDTLYILETNTLPGMTNESLLPKMARVAGMDMSALCSKLVEFALNR
jgi:D-alanine-D-alanine ligase